MRAKTWFMCIILCFQVSLSGQADDEFASNDTFVKNSFKNLTEDLFRGFPSGGEINLVLECSDCPANYFISIIAGILKQKCSGLYIDNEGKKIDRLEINVYNSCFYYDKLGGSLFSKGYLERKFHAGIQAIFLDPSGRILWHNDIEKKYAERIDWKSAKNWENRGNTGIFTAPLPSGNRSRLWEPVIISGLLGGLIYLFFASR